MARPLKIGLDYFPLDVSFDDNIELLEAEEGLEGFAILIKIWQKIYSNGYFIEWNDDSSLLFCKKINTDKTKVNAVINTCLRRNLFDKKMFEKYKILTSCGIQKRFITASYQSKRKSISFITEYILVNSEFTELITEFIRLNTEFSTQSKVKESKVKEIKVKTVFEKTFDDFLLMRKNIKKPATEKAIELIKDKLIKLSNGNEKISIDILNQSIMNSWQDVYALKIDIKPITQTPINRSRAL